jgi:hypothetical protein
VVAAGLRRRKRRGIGAVVSSQVSDPHYLSCPTKLNNLRSVRHPEETKPVDVIETLKSLSEAAQAVTDPQQRATILALINKLQTEVFELGKQNVELQAELAALKRTLPGRFDAFAESLGFTEESPEGDQCRPTTPRRPDRWAEA